jgi:surfactin family lipopeptide synthetase A/fengycin family lipopeptide synthetase D
MVPQRLVWLAKIPLNASHKPDTHALAALLSQSGPAGRSKGHFDFLITDEAEKRMLALWQKVLKVETVGPDDNFFEIGGHSLKATQLLAYIHQEMKVKMELRTIFEYPTIRELTKLTGQRTPVHFTRIVPIEEMEYYEISHAQKRLWVLDQIIDNKWAYVMPNSYLIEGALDRGALEKTFAAMIRRHESLRSGFIQVNGEPKLRVYLPENARFRFEYLDFRSVADGERKAAEVIRQRVSVPFNLETESLLRVYLIQVEELRHVFVYCLHHIISDGWSTNVFFHECLDLYNAYSRNVPGSLGRLPIQYKDFTAWQRKELSGDNLHRLKTFWAGKLAGDLPLLDIGTDFARKTPMTYNGDYLTRLLAPRTGQTLHGLTAGHQGSLFITLFTALVTLFHRYTGDDDIILGISVAGRDHGDLEKQIGFFVNALPIRLQFEDENFEELLKKARVAILDAYEHQQYPFDCIVEDLHLERDFSHSPLFDIKIVLHNTDVASFEDNVPGLAGLTFNKFMKDHKGSVCDLVFNFTESDRGMILSVDYNTDLYAPERIVQIIDHFENLVSAIEANRKAPVSALAYASSEEILQRSGVEA